MNAPPDPQLAALRAEIRRAGRRVDGVRIRAGFGTLFLYLGVAVWAGISYSVGAVAAAMAKFPNSLAFVVGGMGAWVLCGHALAVAYRSLARRWVRGRVNCLPPTERAALLRSLGSESCEDTRKLVAPLLREVGLPTERVPAPTPPGSGKEPASTE